MSEGKVAIVTVHGTGDTADSLDGDKWFQRGSQFSQRLLQHLGSQGVQADIVPHLWSGANSAWERERGANRLAGRIRRLYDRYDSIHVIGHSHGGNVANDAAVLLKWGLRRDAKNEKFDSLTTVGTPFFDSRTGLLQMLAGILFLLITWGSGLSLAAMLLYVLAVSWGPLTSALGAGSALRVDWTGSELTHLDGVVSLPFLPIAALVLMIASLWFMFGLSRQGVRRILRPRRGANTRTSIFAVWHNHDEAIAFLQRVEELKLEPFPRGALFRGSRAAAIGIGVLSVIGIGVVAPLLYVMGAADVFGFNNGNADEDILGNNIAVAMMGLFFAPLIFTGIYLAYRYLIGGAQEVVARGPMNRFVGGVLRGVAMGRDGDQIPCRVAPRSHTHRCEDHILSGECAARMLESANGAAGRLIDKYRWALFSVGGDSSASLTALTTDAMTWDSLIHTTYFDQPEVASAIANHIARTVRESAHSEAPAAAPPPPPAAAAPQPA